MHSIEDEATKSCSSEKRHECMSHTYQYRQTNQKLDQKMHVWFTSHQTALMHTS